jgi:hypothetical protein
MTHCIKYCGAEVRERSWAVRVAPAPTVDGGDQKQKISEETMRYTLLAGALAAAFAVTACENKTEKAAEASVESTKAAEAAAQASSAATTAADASATAAAAGDSATAEAAGDQAKEAGKAAEEAGDAAAKAGDKAKDAAH